MNPDDVQASEEVGDEEATAPFDLTSLSLMFRPCFSYLCPFQDLCLGEMNLFFGPGLAWASILSRLLTFVTCRVGVCLGAPFSNSVYQFL